MPKPLPVTPAELEALAQEYGTPLQLYSEQGIRAQAQLLTSAFQQAGFSNFKEYFAVKALPNPAVLLALMQEGCGLDCSSTGELWIADKLQCKDIMYTSNYTSKKDLLLAMQQDGVIINLDDVSLVATLNQVCKENSLPFPELICFRVNPGMGNTSSETVSNLLGGPDAKFGLPLETLDQAYSEAKQFGAKRFGIHMMTGSCVLDTPYWADTVGTLLRAMLVLKEKLDITFEFVNIGGGIGIPYTPEQREVNVKDVADTVAGQFKLILGQDAAKWPKLCMENGRFLTGPFGWLVTRCHATKECFGKKFYGVDASMANLMRPGMYNSYHHIEVPSKQQDKLFVPANVVGTLCENNDWFAKDRALPSTAAVGDLFVIFDSGAHAHSMGFQYNAKLRAPEVLIGVDGVPRLIREREVIEDLFSNTVLPDTLRGALPAKIVGKKCGGGHKKLAVCGGVSVLALIGVAALGSAVLHKFACRNE